MRMTITTRMIDSQIRRERDKTDACRSFGRASFIQSRFRRSEKLTKRKVAGTARTESSKALGRQYGCIPGDKLWCKLRCTNDPPSSCCRSDGRSS
jgi:hypothetical protein